MDAGTRLGPYEILSPLGAGGMGEVYRARDGKLGRDVAIKVLPQAFLEDGERRQRFEREARLLASLGHPNIAAVFGLDDAGGRHFLVMELVAGESLAQRLAAGPVPVGEALEIARQVAEGLEAAHEKGIIHRDLKPANVQITPEGRAKLLDFGLAKALEAETAGEDSGSLSRSPTISERMTGTGIILGTAAYMSPEQARGKPVDRRTDIWAFGALLFEMLTGRRLFTGETVSDTLAAVLRADPDWSLLPPDTPPSVRHLLARCLERDPKRRLHDIADARIEIEEAIAPSRSVTSLSGVPAAVPREPARPARTLAYAAAAVAGLALAAFAGWRLGRGAERQTSTPAAPIHSAVPLPAGTRLSGWASPVLALSRDGRKLAFVADKDGVPQQLYVHHLDSGETQLVPGSETGEGPAFSPDGKWVVFAVDVSSQTARTGHLKKFSLSTGLTQSIAEISDYFGASWAEDGTILFSGALPGPLWTVGVDSGRPLAQRVRAGGKEGPRSLQWPQVFPGSLAALVVDGDASAWGDAAVFDLKSRELTVLGVSTPFARYTPTGHILLLQPDGTLLAAPFDASGRRISGAPVAVIKDVAVSGNAAGAFAFSETGSLVYASGYLRGSGRELMRLVRIGRRGEVTPLPFDPDVLGRIARPSPDGRRLAVKAWDGSTWIYDLVRNSRTRLPRGKLAYGDHPAWTPDGERVASSAILQGEPGMKVFWQKTDGSGEPEVLLGGVLERHPLCWTPDGRALIYMSFGGPEETGLWMAPVEPRGAPKRLLAGTILDASLSPDGHWLAYDSGESGSFEVYVQKFPELGQKIQVSSGGGRGPRWSRDGREILYRNGDSFLAVRVEAAQDLKAGVPEKLFENSNVRGYDVAPDGNGLVAVFRPPEAGIIRELHLVTNWFDELRRLAPVSK